MGGKYAYDNIDGDPLIHLTSILWRIYIFSNLVLTHTQPQ